MADFKMNDFVLEGKVAWVTGASYGIGFAIAKAFAAAGAKIVFNDRGQEQLEKGLENYKAAGITDVHGYLCDVTDEEAVNATVKKIEQEVGVVDILVNNAGIIKMHVYEFVSIRHIQLLYSLLNRLFLHS